MIFTFFVIVLDEKFFRLHYVKVDLKIEGSMIK